MNIKPQSVEIQTFALADRSSKVLIFRSDSRAEGAIGIMGISLSLGQYSLLFADMCEQLNVTARQGCRQNPEQSVKMAVLVPLNGTVAVRLSGRVNVAD
jgi:hypothetical protein